MAVMGTAVIQERAVLQNEPFSFDRPETKGFREEPSKKTTSLHQQHNSGKRLSAEPDSQQRLRRTRPNKALIVADFPARQQQNIKIKSHVSSKKGLMMERRQKQCCNGRKESPRSVYQQRERRTKSEATASVKHGEDVWDSASDLSDSERRSVLPPQIAPPDLHLQAEVIDPSEFQSLRLSCRGRNNSRCSYPDFLPPPFNTWTLKQLAVYLNTDGKGIPRPKPVGQLERYLDRLLQMEWHQIQTVQKESCRSSAPILKGHWLAHTTSHFSLSSPKCILQCQRAFPLALLSSLANTSTLQLPSCTCPHCKNRYPILNLTCRSYSYHHHHTRLSPVLEKRGQASGFAKRSCSESRAHQFEQRHKPREHRLSEPSRESCHLKRMQAIGNIRNPVSSVYKPDHIFSTADTFSTASLHDVKLKRSGQRSHSCLGVREVGNQARGRSEQKKSFDKTGQDSKLSVDGSSDGFHKLSSKDFVASQQNRKQKHVEFVTK